MELETSEKEFANVIFVVQNVENIFSAKITSPTAVDTLSVYSGTSI